MERGTERGGMMGHDGAACGMRGVKDTWRQARPVVAAVTHRWLRRWVGS